MSTTVVSNHEQAIHLIPGAHYEFHNCTVVLQTPDRTGELRSSTGAPRVVTQIPAGATGTTLLDTAQKTSHFMYRTGLMVIAALMISSSALLAQLFFANGMIVPSIGSCCVGLKMGCTLAQTPVANFQDFKQIIASVSLRGFIEEVLQFGTALTTPVASTAA